MLGTRELFPGTLDMLILKALSLGPAHGYGVLLGIEEASRGLLTLEQGSVYPALARLERSGVIRSEWGRSENNRRAKFYRLTQRGQSRLAHELSRWDEMVRAVFNVLDVKPESA
ncbi:MAG: PadR family transcriptional regulator [Gemmatimonadales bacterium]|nr:MAG: PadR family transcriptional regulator [Gemmatimonadales bacterium]